MIYHKQVLIGQSGEDEELDDTGLNVLLDTPESITVHWIAKDLQSGLENIHVAIGTAQGLTDLKSWQVFPGDSKSAFIDNLELVPFLDSKQYYYAVMKVKNKAGDFSTVKSSKPIYVQKANVPGVVFDGRDMLKDADFQHDKYSIAASFIGFESEACNIVGYEWAVGSKPYYSDKLPFTDYGIVMHNTTFGHAQIHLDLYESETYYVLVRARTGHRCKDEYIVSSSNGIMVDTRPPTYTFDLVNDTYTPRPVESYPNVYQTQENNIDIQWNATDDSGIKTTSVMVGDLPFSANIYNATDINRHRFEPGEFKVGQGKTVFVTISTVDKSGIRSSAVSPAITIDLTPPQIDRFVCTPVISFRKSAVSCTWDKIKEYESKLVNIAIAISSTTRSFDVLNFTSLPLLRRDWSIDLLRIIQTTNWTSVIITMNLENIQSRQNLLDRTIVIDRTPPTNGHVNVVTSMFANPKGLTKQQCQIPKDYIEVDVTGFADEQSDIDR